MASIVVIIPFYQTTPGLLGASLRSVFTQKIPDDVRVSVLVVDDASPVPALAELGDLAEQDRSRVTIIRPERNGGAAAARNLALDKLPSDADFVAFLDSDDCWLEHHLAHALACMDAGADLYFTNHQRASWPTDKFSANGMVVASHETIDKGRRLYKYVGCPFDDILNRAMIQTPTCVIRRANALSARFPVFLTIGEDSVYVARVAVGCRSLAFCADVELSVGEGINISQSAPEDFAKRRRVLLHRMQYKHHEVTEFAAHRDVCRNARRMLGDLRKAYLRLALEPRQEAGHWQPLRDLAEAQRYDPDFLSKLPVTLASLVFRKLRSGLGSPRVGPRPVPKAPNMLRPAKPEHEHSEQRGEH